MTSDLRIAAAAGALVASVTFLLLRRTAQKRHLPPGPSGLPLVGNLLDLPSSDSEPWLVYEKWGEKFNSELIHLNILGTNMIVVNSAKAATALFERKSGIYSDRPRMTMINELIGLSWLFGFMPHGDHWRKVRKTFYDELNPARTTRFLPNIRKWNNTFLKNILSSPERFADHIQHWASGIVLETTFGMQVQPSGQPDPFIGAAKQAVEALMQAGLYGSYLVDFIPFLKYIPAPFAPFRRQAKHWKVSVDIAGTVPYDLVKNAVAAGTAEPSVAADLVQNGTSNPEDEAVNAQATHAMFANGSAAVVSAFSTFFLAMTLYPEVQKKAQLEIDKFLSGKDRLPDFSDEESLPYISAIIKEVLRWNPVVPLAFPHRLTTDDSYDGYHLPAGSVVVPNTWAILHDEELYGPKTYQFHPERFLTEDGKINHSAKGPDAAFGFARRVCPGKHLVHQELFLAIATTLATFNISKFVDADGHVVEPSGEYTSGLLRYPLPFQCQITPRSDEIKSRLSSL